ncbi:MAG: flippase-like domain-containing protein [Synergistaceae bacterium]|jgi:uncharacterized protein (TIRG00374 family)|nr:flippase-like domain-containing protein [Synergistaceae bacterium]
MAEFPRKRIAGIVLKYGASVFCLFYVFRGVPFADLTTILGRYPILPMLGVVAVSFAAYAIMGLRLSFMAEPPLSFRSTFCATLVGLAINNVLPAKAGEIAKAVWMGRGNGVSSQKTLGIVFMERFFDVNVLALLSLWFLWTMGERGAAAIFVACLTAGWCVLSLFRAYPSLAERFTSLFGRGNLRRFVSQALSGVLENMSPGRLIWLSAASLTIWCFYSLQMILGVNAVARLGLPWNEALSIFAVSGLGMLLPSSPGAIGVYEAVLVTALKHYGVGPDEALALALFSHMAQFIPVTLAGGLIFAAFPAKREGSRAPTEL